MTTAFRSIGAEYSEWARGLYPTGLVSTGGKSGVKITAARTVRGSALLLSIPSIPSWPRGTSLTTGPCGPRHVLFVVLSPGKESSTVGPRVLWIWECDYALANWCLVPGRHWSSMSYCISHSAHR